MSNVIKLKLKPKNMKPDFSITPGFVEEKELEEEIERKKEQKAKYQKAFNEGYQAARTELQNEYDSQLIKKAEEFYKILSSFEEKLIDYDTVIPKVITNVSLLIAEKIIGSELKNKTIIETTIKKAIQKIAGANEIIVKLNPNDFEYLNISGNLEQYKKSDSKIKFELDEKIEMGGCLIESEIGNVDARISSQLTEITRALQSNLENS